MSNILFSYLTRENITLAIAILGAVGTVSGWMHSFLSSRKKVDVKLIKAFEPFKTIVVYLSFQNKSRLPISINSVSIVIGDDSYQCELIPCSVYSVHQKNELVADIKTIAFPLNLSPLSGSAGFVEFELPPEDLRTISTHLTLRVSTNRGNLPRKIFVLDGWDDVAPFL